MQLDFQFGDFRMATWTLASQKFLVAAEFRVDTGLDRCRESAISILLAMLCCTIGQLVCERIESFCPN